MPSRPNRFMVSSNCYINMLFIDLLPFPQGILHMYLFYQYRVSATQHERTCGNSSFVWYTVHFFHMWTLLGQMLKLFPCLIYKGWGARPMRLVFGNVEYKEIQFHFITTFPELFFCDLWNTNLRLCTNAKKKKFYEIKTELKHKNPNLIQKSISIFEILFLKPLKIFHTRVSNFKHL